MQNWTNPEIFQVNRLDTFSDFKRYNSNLDYNEMTLNGEWKFKYSNNLQDIDMSTINEQKNSWANIEVPLSIELNGYGNHKYVNTQYPWDGVEDISFPQIPDNNEYGTYVKEFVVPKNWDAKPIKINFMGVEPAFDLWLNGEYIGYAEDSFTESHFDLTKHINYNSKNTIVVRVYKFATSSWLEDQDFWRFFGIFRDVKLYTHNEHYVNDIKIETDIDFNNDVANVQVDVKHNYPEETNIEYIISYKNKKVLSSYDSKVTIINPQLWSPDYPNLYELEVTIDGEYNEVINTSFGIREIIIEDKILKLNKDRIVFKGVNRHEFNCKRGRNVTREDMEWDVKFLKNNNFNAVRCSHYPAHPYFYELCDKYGIMVIDEANLETHGTWQMLGTPNGDRPLPNDEPEYREAVLDRARSLYLRSKNHPSIIMWSLGNESYGGKTLYEMSELLRSLDSRRPIHYEGIFWDRRYNETSDVESRMYARVDEIKELLSSDFGKPFILCEFTHAMGNSNGGMKEYVELADIFPQYQGGFVWEMFEQQLFTSNGLAYGGDFGDRPNDYNFIVDGIVTANREKTQKVNEIKYLYQPFEIEMNDHVIKVKNTYDTYNVLNDHEIRVTYYENGIAIHDFSRKLFVENKKAIEFQIPKIHVENEMIVHCEIVNLVDINGVSSLSVIAKESFTISGKYKASFEQLKELKVIDGDVNISAIGEDFMVMFCKATNQLSSIKYGENEFIPKIGNGPKPHFWRAPTNNDYGANVPNQFSIWKLMSYNANIKLVEVEKSNTLLKIKTEHSIPYFKEIRVYLQYEINGYGEIKVTQEFAGVQNISEMFGFGWRMDIPTQFKLLQWYGNGPEESYVDRNNGVHVSKYEEYIFEQDKYIVPQEYGNKTEVRYACILNDRREGIKFEAISNPLNVNYKETNDADLESQFHSIQKNSEFNEVKIYSSLSGVAGDDSWGSWCLDNYKVKSNETQLLEFKISPINQ